MGIGEHLHLDVLRRGQVAFEQHAVVPERGTRFAAGAGQRGLEPGGVRHEAHAFAATAGGCLDEQGEAHPRRFPLERGVLLIVALIAGHHRGARRLHQLLRLDLGAHCANRRRGWAHEHAPRRRASLGEGWVFGQEPVTGVYRVRAGGGHRLHDALDVEVASRGRGRADADGFVGLAHVGRRGIRIGIHGHGLHTHAPRRADDAAGDFASIGDEQRSDHRPTFGRCRMAWAASLARGWPR